MLPWLFFKEFLMSRITDILVKVRDTLADHSKQRWSDAMLLRILDEGQKDLAKHTKSLKGFYQFSPQVGVAEYTLPGNIWIIKRVAIDDTPINFITYESMDNMAEHVGIPQLLIDSETLYAYKPGANWYAHTASMITAIVYDNRNVDKLRVYPIPDEGFVDYVYDFDNAGTVEYVGDEVLGVVTELGDYSFSSYFGVVTALYDPAVAEEVFSSDFGVITDISETDHILSIWYIRIPDTIASIEDELEISTACDTALRLYTIGNAFLNDNDAAFASKASSFLGLYERELEELKKTTARDHVHKSVTLQTEYRGPF